MSEEILPGPWPDPHPSLRPVPQLDRRREIGRNVALAAPLVLVTVTAIFGQYAWFASQIARRGNLPIPVGLAALICALTVETISLFLAAEAHARLMAGDPAGPVRTMSYAAAAFVGIVNWSHWRPGIIAVVFGVMSALAPFLWAVRSRSLRRAELRMIGALDEPSVKLGWQRWVLYPQRSWRIYRVAVWDGITDPATALALDAPSTPVPAPPRIVTAKPAPQAQVEPDNRVAEIRARLAKGQPVTARGLAEEGRFGSKSTAAALIAKAKA